MKKDLKINIMITIITIILFFAGLEVVLRVMHVKIPIENVRIGGPLAHFDPYIGYVLIPDTNVIEKFTTNPDRIGDERHLDDIIFHNISSQGLRDDIVLDEKKKPRIILLGDSYIYGDEVNREHNIEFNMERLLDKKYNVINLGVPGYSTFQEYRFLEKKGLDFNPDMVLTFFSVKNDGIDNTQHRPYYNGSTIIEPKKNAKNTQVADDFLDNLYAYTFLKRRFITLLEIFGSPADIDIQLKASGIALSMIENITKTNNITHVVVILVPGEMVIENNKNYTYFRSIYEGIKKFLEEKHIKYIDTYPFFISYNESKTYFYFIDNYFMENWRPRHLTPEGHSFIAEIVVKELSLTTM